MPADSEKQDEKGVTKRGSGLALRHPFPQRTGARLEFLLRYSEHTRIHTKFEPGQGERAIE